MSRQRLLLVAGALAAALAVVAARIAVDGRAALRAGEQAERGGDRGEAIRQYMEAARLYLPGGATPAAALDRLEAIASQAEQAADPATARQALEAARAAILGTRSFYTPEAGRLGRIDGRLAAIYARVEDPRVDPGASPEARAAWHAARLARRPGPAVVPSLVALCGLGLWIGAAVGFVTRGLDPGLRLRRRPAVVSGIAFAIGFALFLAGLRLA